MTLPRHITLPTLPTLAVLLALAVAIGGVSYAAGGNGDSLVAKNSLSGNRLKNDTVTGKQVKESTLGPVKRAAQADKALTLPAVKKGALAFRAGWGASVFVQRTPRWVRDTQGFVHLEGAATRSSGTDLVIAVLPAGVRPSNDVYVPVYGDGGTAAYLQITNDGFVQLVDGPVSFVSLEGVTFRAEQ